MHASENDFITVALLIKYIDTQAQPVTLSRRGLPPHRLSGRINPATRDSLVQTEQTIAIYVFLHREVSQYWFYICVTIFIFAAIRRLWCCSGSGYILIYSPAHESYPVTVTPAAVISASRHRLLLAWLPMIVVALGMVALSMVA